MRNIFLRICLLILIPGYLQIQSAHAAPFAYITNNDDDTVSVMDLASNAIVTTVGVGTGPYGLAVNPAGTRVYVANLESDNVSVINTATNTVVDTVVVGDGPFGVAVNPEGTKVYVTNSISNTVSVIDTATGNVIATVDVGSTPYGITVNPAGTKVYVANLGSNDVSVINTTSDTVVATVPVGTGPYGVAVNPAGTRAYVTNRDSNNVSLIDTATNTVIAPTIPMGINPCGLAVNPAGTRVYVANWHSNSVSVINTGDNSVASIAVGTFPDGGAVSPDGTRVYAANYGSNNVSVIDTASNLVVATTTVGSGPIAFGNFIAAPPAVTDGLISLWRGEGNGFDVFGGNHGTLQGGTAFAAGKLWQAFSFAGTSYVQAPDSVADFGNNPFTVSFWMYAPSDPPSDAYLVGRSHPDGGQGWDIRFDDNAIKVCGVNGWGFNIVSASSVALNNWHHIAVASTGSLVTLYIDGVVKGTSPRSAITSAGNPFRIGYTSNYGGSGFNGLIDDVSIYNRALSPKEVMRLVDPNGPVSWWRGEADTTDSIGNNDGTWQGTPAYGTGVFGNAFVFNSVDNQVNIPDSPSLNFDPTSPMSLSFWFKRADNSTTANLIGKRSGCGAGEIHYQVAIDPTNKLHFNSGGQVVSFNTIPPVGTWNHAAVSFDGSTARLYLNGELVNTAAITLGGATSAPLEIGKSGSCTGFNGEIDDVKIYNRPLSDAEIANNYGLVSWWKADTNALDSAGANNGSWNGTPTYDSGIAGEAFSLDGSGKSVTVPASGNWVFGTGDFAISFWAYSDEFSARLPLINNRRTPASNNMWAIEVYPVANRVEFHSGLTIYLTATNLLTNSSWNHITVTRSGSTLSMYINGVPSGSAANSANFSDINDLQIGRDIMSGNDLGGKNFQGLIDDVKVYKRALSAAEVSMLANIPDAFSFASQTGMPLSTPIVSNPITVAGLGDAAPISITACTGAPCEYNINDGSWTSLPGEVNNGDTVMVRQTSSGSFSATTTATLSIGGVSAAFTVTTAAAGDPNSNGLISWWRGEDSTFDSVGGNHGTPSGNLSYAVGQSGQAFSLDGNTYIHIATATPLDRMTQLTLSAWLKIRGSHEGGTHLISGRAAGTQLYTDGSGYLVFNIYDGSTWYPVTSKAPLPVETWVHIAGTLDTGAGESNLYINGVLDGSASVTTLPAENSNPFNIGGFTGYGSYLNGLIDEVKLYNRTLSAVELGRIYGIVPDPFSFNSVTGATRSATVESESIDISGLSHPATISISGGEYQINSDDWTTASGTINPGATVKVHLNTSASFSTTTTATLTIGGMNGTFSVTTLADTEKPVVTGFTLAETESTAMSVAVTSFTATDNDVVSGYLVTASATPPLPGVAGWSGAAPLNVSLTTAGSNVLRAWAKDPAGNVSDPLTATVLLKPVRRGTSSYTYYDSLSVACGEALTGETIRALAVTVPGNVTLSGGKSHILSGGYDDGYGAQNSYTAIQGTLTVGTGFLTVERMVIR
jgi:YVTN family beta-propeller protein